LKEYAADNPRAMLGEGDVKWPDVFRMTDAFGATEWYIIEQEIKGLPQMQTAERCLKNLRALGR
jgi:sugar phosphate isomerase/epimerase